MSFATVAALQDRLRSDVDATQAQAVLDAATSEIVFACQGVQLTEVVDDTVVLQGSGTDELSLPLPPVTSVASVTDGDSQPVTGFTFKSTVRRRVRSDRLVLDEGVWDRDDTFLVTYTHGFTDVSRPDFLSELCLRLALRMWVNPEQVMQKRRGDYSMSFGSSTVESSGMTRYELAMLARAGLRRTAR